MQDHKALCLPPKFHERLLIYWFIIDTPFKIAYKQGCEQEQGDYNYPATQTPGYQSQRKLDPLKDVSPSSGICNADGSQCNLVVLMGMDFFFLFYNQKNYRQHIDQVKYSPVTDTPDILLAKKNARLVSNVCHMDATVI